MPSASARADADTLRARDRLFSAVRAHFRRLDYIEVDTPLIVPVPALEDYIDAIPAAAGYLRTSPELHMKRLLADGIDRIFQIGPCFRLGEHGSRHRDEFMMLEWYRAHADYELLLRETMTLLQAAATGVWGRVTGSIFGESYSFDAEPEILTVDAAFRRFAHCSAEDAITVGQYEELLVTKVEPRLGFGRPSFLIDYPLSQAALARVKPANPAVAERWELYVAGIELANAYSELTDPVEQRARFMATAALRAADGREVYPIDEDFLRALPHLPPTAGCALGFDRLLMVLCSQPQIAHVRPFDPFPHGGR